MVLTATRRVVSSPQLERRCGRGAELGMARSSRCWLAAASASLPLPPPAASLLPPYSDALPERDRTTRGRRRVAPSAGERAAREPLRLTGGLQAALCSVSSSTLSTSRILLDVNVVLRGRGLIPAFRRQAN